MPLDHARRAWPRFFATTISGMPLITASGAHVCRMVWMPTAGSIFARWHARLHFHLLMRAAPLHAVRPRQHQPFRSRPAHSCLNKPAPSSVRTTWRGLPDLRLPDRRCTGIPD